MLVYWNHCQTLTIVERDEKLDLSGSIETMPPSRTIAGRQTGKALLVVVIVLVLLFGTITTVLVGTALFFPTVKNIPSYTSTVSTSSSAPTSLTIEDTNGQIILTRWTGSVVLINATVTARGLGSSPDAVTFDRSSGPGAIVFKAILPRVLGIIPLPVYTVDINVYVPEARLGPVTLTNTNGQVNADGLNATSVTLTSTNGHVQATSITTDSLTLSSTNGSVDFDCSKCPSVYASTTNGAVRGTLSKVSANGSYHLSSTNGGITLKVPSDSGFKLSAHTTNGSISSTLPSLNIQTENSLDATVGTGTATVNLSTTNGSITINPL